MRIPPVEADPHMPVRCTFSGSKSLHKALSEPDLDQSPPAMATMAWSHGLYGRAYLYAYVYIMGLHYGIILRDYITE